MGRAAANGGRAIGRATVSGIAAIAWVCSFLRRPPWAPAPFLAALLSLAIMVHTCILPVPLAFLFVAADAEAVTEGCETGTCCTALCYVDSNGVHHCVHKHGDSCDCGFSTGDDLSMDLMLHPIPAMLPKTEPLLPVLVPQGQVSHSPSLLASFNPPTPSPPPK
jgi:hypothetical protein